MEKRFPVRVKAQNGKTYSLKAKKIIPNQKQCVNDKRHSVVNTSKGKEREVMACKTLRPVPKKTTRKRSICSVSERVLHLLEKWIRKAEQGKDYGYIYEGEVWFHNTYEEWAELLGVSVITIRRTIHELTEEGKIRKAFLSKNKHGRALFYTLSKNVNGKRHYFLL